MEDEEHAYPWDRTTEFTTKPVGNLERRDSAVYRIDKGPGHSPFSEPGPISWTTMGLRSRLHIHGQAAGVTPAG